MRIPPLKCCTCLLFTLPFQFGYLVGFKCIFGGGFCELYCGQYITQGDLRLLELVYYILLIKTEPRCDKKSHNMGHKRIPRRADRPSNHRSVKAFGHLKAPPPFTDPSCLIFFNPTQNEEPQDFSILKIYKLYGPECIFVLDKYLNLRSSFRLQI